MSSPVTCFGVPGDTAGGSWPPLASGELEDTLLGAVIHIVLVKKEPAWLMRNSQPVLLQPSLRQAEAGVQFRRLMTGAEVAERLPPEMFAYRAEMPGHWCPPVAPLAGRLVGRVWSGGVGRRTG